ncbi:Piwi domain-containing protein [Caenorhabditis elegans]|uniref:Piwi domain-containing protein n=1 Tax=Caenorhabditis elegans TaxID=6239 RepID=Q9XVF1_CAEEL|nr:Piwi domain-containing protein [Caenorhabditis elegans]CAB03833.1 Piwi domain-containing protein [Caenorhabditis elegans]|eukprot:NP_492573.1 Uncharacterized protein CELE_C04F12.1 [Caenorhabditis elegans]
MPSKKNKKAAAAERSATLSASASQQVAKDEQSAPVVPTPELSRVSVSSNPPTPSAIEKPVPLPVPSKPLFEYEPPAQLEALAKNKPVKVTTNSYELELKPTPVFRYDVSVLKSFDDSTRDPIELAGSKGGDRQRQADLTEIVKVALTLEGLGNLNIFYDGAAMLFTTQKFETKTEKQQAIFMPIPSDHPKLSTSLKESQFGRASGKFHVSIELNSKQSELNTIDLLNERLDSAACPVTQMAQIALSAEAKQNGFIILDGGHELFDQKNTRRTIGKDGVEDMDGVAASIKMAQGNKKTGSAHLVMDYKKKQFFKTGPLKDLIKGINPNQLRSYLKGLRVHTTYSHQSIFIDGISNVPIGEIKLPDGTPLLDDCARVSGKPKSFFDASKPAVQVNQYNKREGRRMVYSFPIENLLVKPNQKLTQNHGEPPRSIKPELRFDLIRKVGESAKLLSPNQTLKSIGIAINPEPIVVEAMTVPKPTILYKDGAFTSPDLLNRTSWDVQARNHQSLKGGFVEPMKINKILILYNSQSYSQASPKEAVVELQSILSKKAKDVGMTIGQIDVEDLNDPDIIGAIENKMTILKTSQVKPIVIYADHTSEGTHSTLKLQERLCEVITQQVALDKSLKRTPGKVTANNLLMKLNLKYGGVNHKVRVDNSISHLWGDTSNTLIISYDVCHSSGKVYKKDEICDEPSCVGFGFNGTACPEAFIGDFHYQLPRHEQVDEHLLKLRARFMLNHYITSRKKYPQQVVILRDGVSEGQHKMVRNEEFQAIKQSIMNVFNEKKAKAPSFALLVVTKRHANRLLIKDQNGYTNVPPLTAIDQTIVKKQGNEVIFVSHCPLNGTAQPIVINTLVNDGIFKTNDQLVQFITALCCAHQKSTNIVSLPESIYAADEYAKRGADLFQSYKLKHRDLPTTTIDDSTQLDYEKITLILCFQTSSFKNKRIA